MAKPMSTIYLDSNIFSILFYSGPHTECLTQQLKTRNWWDTERQHFQVYTSQWTLIELREGEYRAQKKALAEANRHPFLAKSHAVDELANKYIEHNIIPSVKFGDAIQLAFVSVYEIDYLLTWNYSHLANPKTQHALSVLHLKLNLRNPWLVSPETIPWHSMGKDVRRRSHE